MEEKTGEAMLEELLKVEPDKLGKNAQKLFYTIMKVIDERDELQKENWALREDIKFCLHSIKQEMELSKDSRTRSEMNDCYEILKGWVK